MRKSVSLSIFILCVSLLAPRPSPINSQTPLDFELVQMLGHGTAESIAWSPDGETLAVGGSRGIWLYQDEFQTSFQLETTLYQVHSVAWNPQNNHELALAVENSVYIVQADTGARLRALNGHTEIVIASTWNTDGKRIATSGLDGTLRIWDVATGQQLYRVHHPSHWASRLIWSPDGNQVAALLSDNSIAIWTLNANELETFAISPHQFYAFDWKPDGTQFALGSDGQILIVNPHTHELIHRIEGFKNRVDHVVWKPDGSVLASADSGGTIMLWDGLTYQALHTLQQDAGRLQVLAWKTDGNLLASLSSGFAEKNSVYIWNPVTATKEHHLTGFLSGVERLAWSTDGMELSAGHLDKSISLWDVSMGELTATIPIKAGLLSWDAEWELVAGTFPSNHTVGVWDWRRLREDSLADKLSAEMEHYLITKLVPHASDIWSIAWSPDSRMVASSADDFRVHLSSVATGKLLFSFRHNSQGVFGLSWNPNGQMLASAEDGAWLHLWGATTGNEQASLRDESDLRYANVLAWHPAGSLLASGSVDGYLRIWDRQDNRLIRRIQAHEGQIFALAWRPDGSLLASAGGDGFIQLWEAATGELIDSLAGHVDEIRALAWRPDGIQLASAGLDGTIHIWEHIQD